MGVPTGTKREAGWRLGIGLSEVSVGSGVSGLSLLSVPGL